MVLAVVVQPEDGEGFQQQHSLSLTQARPMMLHQPGDWASIQDTLLQVDSLVSFLKNSADAANCKIVSNYHAQKAVMGCFMELLQLREGPVRLRAQAQILSLQKMDVSIVFTSLRDTGQPQTAQATIVQASINRSLATVKQGFPNSEEQAKQACAGFTELIGAVRAYTNLLSAIQCKWASFMGQDMFLLGSVSEPLGNEAKGLDSNEQGMLFLANHALKQFRAMHTEITQFLETINMNRLKLVQAMLIFQGGGVVKSKAGSTGGAGAAAGRLPDDGGGGGQGAAGLG